MISKRGGNRMDLQKIGKYIAGKRKKLGLTQKQLAEQLGMSDKSVSKWERGICLPDVSVYIQLCNILQISINEFLSGEDLSEENVIKQSEYNLIQVASISKYKQKYLKRMIIILSIIIMIVVSLLGTIIFRNLLQPQNYIIAADRESAEMKTAELLSGVDGAFLFHYSIKDKFETLTIFMSEYQSGKLIEKTKVADFTYRDMEATSEGQIVLVPDFEQFSVKLIVTDEYAKYSTTFPILENVENKEYYGRAATQIEEKVPIQFGSEQGLLAFIYGKDEVSGVSISAMENGEARTNNDYVYYLSFEFSK